MEHKNTLELYDLAINQNQVEKNPTLKLVYGNTETLFLDLKDNFYQINVDDSAVITLEIKL
jgi:hypothetical protein